ncbi:MAG: hypothetical protein ACOYK8_00500 [Alphaproteobacteria bacterium]
MMGISMRQHALSLTVSAPVKGWMDSENIAAMNAASAIRLDNWFPETDRVRLRRGYNVYATGLGTAAVEALMDYAAGGSRKLLAAANGKIYDITNGSVVELASGFSSNRWQHVNVNNRLIMVNGVDAPQIYDGTSLSAMSITGSGLSVSSLIGVNLFKGRLYFTQQNSLKFWYLPVNAIAGTAVSFDLSFMCRLGGSLQAIGTWTRDGGDGADDIIVFITDRGEVLLYDGADPSSATDWSLIGVFRVGAPVGRRCLIKAGGDLGVIVEDGFLPLNQVLPYDRGVAQKLAISSAITNNLNEAVRLYKGNFGWQAVPYPRGHMLLFNIPTREGIESQQYVMNSLSGAWCRFTGMNAACWTIFEDKLYFGGMDGRVYLADNGYHDNGAAIMGDMKTAFNYAPPRQKLKRFTLCRPLLSSDGNPSFSLDAQVDFDDSTSLSVFSSPSATGTASWDNVNWDIADWAGLAETARNWLAINGLGYAVSLRLRLQTSSLEAAISAYL